MSRNIGVLIKLHPFQAGVDTIRDMLSRYVHVKVVDDSDSLQFVLAADVLITQTSTIAIEAVILGVPVIGLVCASVFLGETLGLPLVLAAGLIIVGIVLGTMSGRRKI